MTTLVHREQARKVWIGVVTLAVLAGVGWVGFVASASGTVVGKTYTYVTAAFTDVSTLRDRNDVRENSVRVGSVSSIVYSNHRALVTMRLDGSVPVYANASAKIWNVSALARKFIELDPGTPSSGPLGDRTITTAHTQNSVSLEDLFNILDAKTRTSLGTSLRALGGGLAGHGQDLHDAIQAAPYLLTDLGTVSRSVSSNSAQLAALLSSANRLAGRFAGSRSDLSGVVDQLGRTLTALNVDNGQPLARTLNDLPGALQAAQSGLSRLNAPLADLQKAVTDLRPGGAALGAATPALRAFLRNAVNPLQKLPAVASEAQPAVSDLNATVVDARPLVPQLVTALSSLRVLLGGLSPYAADVGTFFAGNTLLAGELTPTEHYFSAQAVFPGLYAASVPDPLAHREPYPAPGRAAHYVSGGN